MPEEDLVSELNLKGLEEIAFSNEQAGAKNWGKEFRGITIDENKETLVWFFFCFESDNRYVYFSGVFISQFLYCACKLCYFLKCFR